MDNSTYFGRPSDQQQPQQQSSASALSSQTPSTSFNPPRRQTMAAIVPDRSSAINSNNNNNNTQLTSLNSSYTNGQSSFGPMRGNRSSLRAHRSSMYTRPNYSLNNNSMGPSASYISNRYFGNSSNASKSVILGAKKSTEINDLTSLQPELTATAKRIIQSLHTASTPVLNKEKFLGMESIKSLRPDLTSGSLKRKVPTSSGPPIHLSQSIPQPLPLKAARFENNNAREAHLEDDEYQFPDAWSFDGIENGVRHLPKQNIDVKYLMKLYEDKKKSEDNAANKFLTKLNTPAVTIGESKPANLPLATIAQESKWECSVCMVYNNAQDSACVCCGEKNPNAAKWECSVCLVKSKAQDSACVCCGEKNPNAASANTNSGDMTNNNEGIKSAGGFKFGISTAAVGSAGGAGTGTATTTPLTSNFKFGDDKVGKPAAPATFQFGFNAASNQPKTEASMTPSGSFQFGPNKSGSDSKPAISTSTFGGAKDAQVTTQTQTNNGQGFSFGLTAADTEKFGSGIKVQPLSGFRFGTTPARPSMTNDKTATKSPTVQTWRCSVCRDENNSMLSLKCRGCEATRPSLESSSFKGDTNATTGKDFSFQPYYGLKDEHKDQKASTSTPFVSKLPTFTSATSPLSSTAPASSSSLAPSPQFGTTLPAATVISPNKRKAVPDAFEYNPDPPKLKLKSPPPVSTSEIKSSAGHSDFMEAIKKQRGEDVPDTGNKSGTTGMPTTTTAAAPTLASTATTNSLNSSLTTPIPLSTSTLAPATTSAVVPKPFTFQATSALSASTPTTTSSQQPAPIFGSSLSTATSGPQSQSQSLTSTTQSGNIFCTPATTSSALSTPSGLTSAPAPSFSFGSPPPAFQFGQQPATSTPFVFGGSATPSASPAIATATTTSASSQFSFGQTTTTAASGFGAGGFKPTFAQPTNTGQPPIFGQSASSNMMQPTSTFGSTTPMFNAGGNTSFGAPIQPAAPTTAGLFGMPPIPTGNNLQPQAPGANPNMPALFNLGTSNSERRPIKKAMRRLR